MGYTIGVVCRSKKLAEKLLETINDNISDAIKIALDEDSLSETYCYEFSCYSKNRVETKMSYYHGLDYEFMMAVARWGAIKAGKKRSSFRETEKFYSPIPYLSYDNCEAWPIILEKPKNKKLNWCYYDQYGTHKLLKYNCKMSDSFFFTQSDTKKFEISKLITDILKNDKKSFSFFKDAMYDFVPEYREYCEKCNNKIREAVKLLDEKWIAIK
jgi:hypothetical protein